MRRLRLAHACEVGLGEAKPPQNPSFWLVSATNVTNTSQKEKDLGGPAVLQTSCYKAID
jgi:hypothetical protein